MKILLTGANGYIGKRLLAVLLEEGHEVTCLVRNKNRFNFHTNSNDRINTIEIDLLNPVNNSIPEDIDVAYYLVHSMSSSNGDFTQLENTSAVNFISLLRTTKCKHIIYLSGISNDPHLSKHLDSRKNVETVLSDSEIPLTVLRASIIVGSGSASFEIIRDLVEKLPVMVAPKWLNTKCQPIAIRDVIKYLSRIKLNQESYNRIFDIGGKDILTFKEMLLLFAEVRGLKRIVFTIPVLTPKLSSYWLYFVTAISFKLASSLVDSMKIETICELKGIDDIINISPLSYKEAVKFAFEKIEQNLILSSWSDALSSSDSDDLNNHIEIPIYGCFKDSRIKEINEDRLNNVLDNIWSIGGDRGWYYANFLWKLRGLLDKMVGGVGLRRGRRSANDINNGDALDFWRVLLADKPNKRLLLYAEMKLPGEAWLEFKIEIRDDKVILNQIATYRPKGLIGRMYWYSVLPFHYFIFAGMIRNIVNYRSE
ncbi:MAG: SDR family oxidoreductase [Ignavibacteriota bacterium]|nr:SDR family oxidoreductase [Ignavibacteriota bacterium]